MIGRILPQARFSALKVDADHLDEIKRRNPDLGHAMALEMQRRQYGQESANAGIRLLEQAGVDVVVKVASGYYNRPRQLEIDLYQNEKPMPHAPELLDEALRDSPLLEDTSWGDVVHWALLKHLNITTLAHAKNHASEPA